MGKKLTDYTTRKVIIIILVMLFTNPIFMVETYVKEPNSQEYALQLLSVLDTKGTHQHERIFNLIVDLQKDIDTPMVAYTVIGPAYKRLTWQNDAVDYSTYRS